MVLQKLSLDGDVLWNRYQYNGLNTYLYKPSYSTDVLSNGDLLFAGAYSANPNDATHPYLVRTNTDGLLPVEAPQPPKVEVYPNPNCGQLVLRNLQNAPGEVKYAVWTATGQKIRQGILRETEELDLCGEEDGIYFLRVESEAGAAHTEKLVLLR